MKFNTISLKILLPLITVFVISFLGITIFVVRSQTQFAREQLIKNARVSTQDILASSLDLFIEKKIYDIQFVLINAKKANEDIEYIAIVDKRGKVLAHTEPLSIDEMLTRTEFDRAALTFRTFTVRDIPETQDAFEVCTPMLAFGSEKEVLGVLRIGINQRTIHEKIRQIRRNIIGVGIVAVLISIIIFTGIVDLIVNQPMKRLIHAAKQVSVGNLDIAIPVRSHDEIGYFSRMFNQMAQNLKNSQENYRTLVDNLNVGVYRNTTGPHGLFLRVNPALIHIFGYDSIEEFMTKQVSDLYQNPENRKKFIHVIEQHGSVRNMELAMQKKDGESIWISVSANAAYDPEGKIKWIDGIIEDITDKKHAEQERLRAMSLRQEKEAAEAANRVKTIFLANMTHELRTPLNGVLGYAHVLTHDSSLTDKQLEAARIIRRNGEHLLMLIDDILDFTKIETDQLKLQPVEFVLPRILDKIVEITRIHVKQKRLSFQPEVPSDLPHLVYGDEKRLRQILLNLLGNSNKFTERGVVIFRVLLENRRSQENTENRKDSLCSSCLRGKNVIRFEIQDTGIGIEPKQMEKIFQPFWQPGTYLSHSEGTGLGLTISQRLAEKMGSQIHITSTVGEGTTCWFEVELPVIAATVMEELQQPRQPQELPPMLSSQETLTTALNALPVDWLHMLKKGAEDVDPMMLSDVINRIRSRDPVLANALVELTEEFEYDEILRLIQESVYL